MRTIGLTVLVALGLATPAMADDIVPSEYQGVWAAARDCKDNFQNIRAGSVDREFAACRVVQVARSDRPDSRTSSVRLDCGGRQSREIWHGETIDDADFLIVVRSEPGRQPSNPRSTCTSDVPASRSPRFRSAIFPAIRSRSPPPRRKSSRPRPPLTPCAIVHIHIGERATCGSTAGNRSREEGPLGDDQFSTVFPLVIRIERTHSWFFITEAIGTCP